jgi:hypothetical protein
MSDMVPGRRYAPMTGVELWKNPKNRFFVFQVHFTANEQKRDPSYIESIKAAMPIRQFNQEYNLNWESYAGTPVYPDFQRSIHGFQGEIEPVLGLPLIRGWDFGVHSACVVAQYVGVQLRVIKEFTAINKGSDTFVPEVLAQCRVNFPFWGGSGKDWIDTIDPAGQARTPTDMSACAQSMTRLGLSPLPGPVAFEPRRSAVEYFLTRYTKQGPNFQISLSDCPTLVRGFEGGYRYNEKALEIEPQKIRPLKDEHSHPHDALQYVCAAVRQRGRVKIVNVPSPQYHNPSRR